MHPSDYTDTFVLIISGLESGRYLFGRIYRTFIYYFYGQETGFVQSIYHLVRVCIYRYNRIAAIQKLRPCNEPYLEIIEIIHGLLI